MLLHGLRENLWFDCKNGQFLTFDEVLSIIGESTGLYRLQAKHEANYDLDELRRNRIIEASGTETVKNLIKH